MDQFEAEVLYHPDRLTEWTGDVTDRLMEGIEDLTREQMMGPYHPFNNPLLWEVLHAGWFIERWFLREHLGREPRFDGFDDIYDSTVISHGRRWVEELHSPEQTRDFLTSLAGRVETVLHTGSVSREARYYLYYAILHADMHTEALTYQRQTLGYPAPDHPAASDSGSTDPVEENYVPFGEGTWRLGADPEDPFCFDNEKWAHEVTVDPFELRNLPVTQGEYRQFVEAGGYESPRWWSEPGWSWRTSGELSSPRYWRRGDGGWERRQFDRWVPLEPDHVMIHVSWYEARAYCRWDGSRLPTEAEWMVASTVEPGESFDQRSHRPYPWGAELPRETHARLDWRGMGSGPASGTGAGESPAGIRSLIGTVWEWTVDPFEPFPGFEPDYYRQYSEPWFGSRKVLKGGCFATRSRLARSGYRNFYSPNRNDVLAGFRPARSLDP